MKALNRASSIGLLICATCAGVASAESATIPTTNPTQQELLDQIQKLRSEVGQVKELRDEVGAFAPSSRHNRPQRNRQRRRPPRQLEAQLPPICSATLIAVNPSK